MIGFIIGTIFGFVGGCTFKELIWSNLSHSGKTSASPQPTKCDVGKDSSNRIGFTKSNAKGAEFNLCSIQYLFDKYGVDLTGVNSFMLLLDKIERVTYKETLKQFSSSVHKPEDLVVLIENGNTYDECLQIKNTAHSILLQEEYIKQILDKNGIDATSINTIEEKVQLIVSFYVSRGLNQFKKTMGASLEQFLKDFKAHKDVSILFDGIMKNINTALEFLA